jgi:protein-S-isoprenylcysteine O-methyltransferase Ste14
MQRPGSKDGVTEKQGSMKKNGFLPPTYLLAAMVAMIVLHFVFPLTRIVPTPWNLLGLIPLGLGVALNLLADRAFKVVQTTVKPFEESSALVTDGAFRISRNPMYLGYVLILLGLGVLMRSLGPLIIIPIFALLMDRIFIQEEEQMLETRFGETWAIYKARVRRWI